MVYRDYLRTGLPQLFFTTQQSKDKADIEAQLQNYVSNIEAQFVKGIVDPNDDAKWNEFIGKLTQIGAQKLVKIYDESYKNYLSIGGQR